MAFEMLPLFAAMLRNFRSKSMNRRLIGHSISMNFPPIRREDIFSYVEATGDREERYGGEKPIAPPFYMARLLFPLAKYYMTSKDLRMNLLKMVHGQQAVRWHSPLRVGDALSITAKIEDIIDTSAGQMLNLTMQGTVEGRLCVELFTSFMVRGTGTMKEQAAGTKKPVRGRELFRRDFRTFEGQQLRYARVSGDRNFVHTSNFLARMAGLRRTIMHGVCLLAMTTNTLMDEVLEGDISALEGISVRFAKPVYPGERITVIGYESGEKGQIIFEAVTESGKLCMKNGTLSFKGKERA